MKMKVIDRILLALYALMVTLALLIAAACLVWPDANFAVSAVISNIKGMPLLERAIIGAVVLVLIVWSIMMIVMAFKRERKGDRSSVAVQNTGDGAVRVSVAAMDTLVRQAIGQVDGVTSIKTRIVNHEDSITVQIDMSLTSDAHIPNVTMLMQRNIKRFIEEFSGIAVREVVILVSDIKAIEAPAAQPTVEGAVPPVLVEPEKVENPQYEAPAAQPAEQADEAPAEENAPVEEAAETEAVLEEEGAPCEEEIPAQEDDQAEADTEEEAEQKEQEEQDRAQDHEREGY